MKICITAAGKTLDDPVDPRFGRCSFFLVVDPETMSVDPVENPNTMAGGGAGIQSAQLMAERDVTVVLTGNCGPNAYRTLTAADIEVIVGVQGTVREVVEQYRTGALRATGGPNVDSHFGTGGGGGSAGRGMGAAGGQGRGLAASGGAGRLVAVCHPGKCNRCGLCIPICPVNAITMNGAAVVDADTCTGCGQCVAECPQEALTLKKA